MFPFPAGERPFSYYGVGTMFLWPPMMLLTRRDWRGQEHLGKSGEGLVLAANHVTWLDPFVLIHFVNDSGRAARFLAKDALFEVPVAGRVLSGVQMIPVHRETGKAENAVSSAVQAVKKGEVVFVYPEGTITRDPEMWPMSGKTGAARIALISGRPLVPIAQWGAHEIMGPYKKELKFLPRKTIHISAGPPLDLDDLRDRPLTAAVLAEATTRLMDAITELESELRGEEPPTERWDRRAKERRPVVRGLEAREADVSTRSSTTDETS